MAQQVAGAQDLGRTTAGSMIPGLAEMKHHAQEIMTADLIVHGMQ
jgi:hypothetical protein